VSIDLYPWRHRRYGTERAFWSLLTPPVQEPVTILEAKQHARISQNDDANVERYQRTAREAAEDHLSRGLFTQTWQLSLVHWADRIPLPRAAPLQSVTSVQYYDLDGVLQTLGASAYVVETLARPGAIVRAPGTSWPSLQSDRVHSGRIVITYVIGWTDIELIPERIKQGIRLYLSYLYCDREGLEIQGEAARKAAEACWNDRVEWPEPDWYGARWPA
jgi:uncharacterized phiE125 gp8 family phage protein